jgi:hypothetical protein
LALRRQRFFGADGWERFSRETLVRETGKNQSQMLIADSQLLVLGHECYF